MENNPLHRVSLLVDRYSINTSFLEGLKIVAEIINLSGDFDLEEGLSQAKTILNSLEERGVPPDLEVVFYYFQANIWATRRRLNQEDSWAWNHPELEKEILLLRQALNHSHFNAYDIDFQCQVMTNLGNALNFAGRCVEAIERYQKVLTLRPNFGMALGNLAQAIVTYAQHHYDEGQKPLMLLHAYDLLGIATSKEAYFETDGYEAVIMGFSMMQSDIRVRIDEKRLRKIILGNHSLGNSEKEIAYRKWCLNHSLFLNPLNDIYPKAISGHDFLHLPSMVIANKEGEKEFPRLLAQFNQLKQEYVSSRYLLFEALNGEASHFSDHNVALIDTFSYPSYSLRTEKIKMVFRTCYSILDKLGFFVNDYFNLGVSVNNVSLKKVWYENVKKRLLHKGLEKKQNLPLRGLFWLSKDLHNRTLKESTEPEAYAIEEIRNYMEHRHLQIVHEDKERFTEYQYHLPLKELIAKTIKGIKLARSGLIYLSLAAHRQEQDWLSYHTKRPNITLPTRLLDNDEKY